MKIFKDQDLKEEVIVLDLGVVQAGDSKEYTFYVHNDSQANLRDLKMTINHKEVEMIRAPTSIDALDTSKLIFKWSPSVTIKQGLKTKVEIKGAELWS